MKLLLGTRTYKPGWECYDKYPVDDRIEYIDLTELPLPFKSDSVDEIRMENSLEHLSVNTLDFMLEMERILKPGGMIIITVPVNNICAEHEKTHFSRNYFNGLCGGSYTNFELVSVRGYGGKHLRYFYYDTWPLRLF